MLPGCLTVTLRALEDACRKSIVHLFKLIVSRVGISKLTPIGRTRVAGMRGVLSNEYAAIEDTAEGG